MKVEIFLPNYDLAGPPENILPLFYFANFPSHNVDTANAVFALLLTIGLGDGLSLALF